ncbi:hypothetical protein [Bifidobacterium stellenboschense]|uniref:Uncharacterized protein n=1 Tax=Bifidobacterium stellenboschense TaxID=762211 RepID=A0A087E0C0_9BIFI|nr:hypothetical protein [Bifidobacterium stellenboschense]KFJ01221.1 hypothetical protein BSTEL_0944 [Bifidobacterium stellenboschense]
MSVCAFDVTIRTRDGRTCTRLPRAYGDSPATILPALSRKTCAWDDSTIRNDFPDKLRLAIDHMDAKTRRTTFRLIAKAHFSLTSDPHQQVHGVLADGSVREPAPP